MVPLPAAGLAAMANMMVLAYPSGSNLPTLSSEEYLQN